MERAYRDSGQDQPSSPTDALARLTIVNSLWRGLALSLVLGLVGAARPASAQETQPSLHPPPAASPSIVTADNLARIRRALTVETPIATDPDGLRFYVRVLAPQRTFADYMKGTDLRFGPSLAAPPRDAYGPAAIGGGIDLLALAAKGVERVRQAIREREIRKIREQIELELQALEAAK